MHGVNLGGWLVAEKWLTPSLFSATGTDDEHELSQTAGGRKAITRHRKTFITETDFKWLAEQGVHLVRIPVGYWLFEAVDGYVPVIKHLDDAMAWAEKHGIDVLIDLHAARGSQNGFAHSGKRTEAKWFTNDSYQRETLDLLVRIAETYKDSPALWGIELLNEPVPGKHHAVLKKFHREAYAKLRAILRPGTYVVYHDAFHPWRHITTFWKHRMHPVMMDVHWYGFELKANDLETYLKRSKRIRTWSLRVLQLWQPVLVGEWSSVLPQRFFDAVPKAQHYGLLRQNIAMQRAAYVRAAGNIYWNYKAEGEGMWNYRSLVESDVYSRITGRSSDLTR